MEGRECRTEWKKREGSQGKEEGAREEEERKTKEEEGMRGEGGGRRKGESKKRALWERKPDRPRGIAWVGCGGAKGRGRYSAES